MDNLAEKNRDLINLVGRILLCLIFLISGIRKATGIEGTAQYMAMNGVPAAGILVYLVVLIEVIGAVAIIVGWQTRLFAFLLAGFTILAAFMFHLATGDQNQMTHFMKNLAIGGGFLVVMANGAGAFSIDARSSRAAPAPIG